MKTEGRNAVVELLKTDKNIDKIMLEKGAQGSLSIIFAQARKKNVRVQFVDRQVLDKESESRRHQGVIAFTTDYEYFDLEEIIAEKKSEKGGFIVLCDGIEDVHNLGSILRVAECAGADGVVIPKTGSASVTEAVIRISAGAAEHMKVAKVGNLNHAVETLQNNGYWVYALEAGGEDIYAEDFSGNVALIVGGEDSGVKRLTKEKCDKVLSIPLQGNVNSLNASVALGIAAYEVVRKRLGK
ncbi:MAG: 23S rRNA (guanosine(2251)-2'-O)-methyltransferase RlmB [Clostridia bacterium]|nr:23S rRNA (guanosine(2251)-2'-O)-methyltransferase RlmB [Clostridia bacterium]